MNRLANEKSPYLLQHAHNPVDWYPWGADAFDRAMKEDRPIFLSIGYSTCHWCHVMERESFEDETVARLLNEMFVPIKVDREERPDVDGVYMKVCQMMTGSGGWPLTIIMTPDRRPFFAATYIPKEDRFGSPGMLRLLPAIDELWRTQRDRLLGSVDRIVEQAAAHVGTMGGNGEPDERVLDKAFTTLLDNFDDQNGGFGRAPKFPSPHNLVFLLGYWKEKGIGKARSMVEDTLMAMRAGGMYDHVGHGFHRYSTDREWKLPHFEKMLYDQAGMLLAYLEGYQATGNDVLRATAEEIADYVLNDMTGTKGGFHSAEDADSEGEEGKFYVWTIEELSKVLEVDALRFLRETFVLSEAGNFLEEATGERTGANVLYRTSMEGYPEPEWEAIRTHLDSVRSKRIRPSLDDKVLTDWNGLMIAALARAGRVLENERYVEAATNAARFITDTMDVDGTLLHRYRDGDAAIPGNLDDYAFMMWGLLELYLSTMDPGHLASALDLAERTIELFEDPDYGGFYFTREDGERLPFRDRETYDGAMPSGYSVAVSELLRLSTITGRSDLSETAWNAIKAVSRQLDRSPTGMTHLLSALIYGYGGHTKIVIVGRDHDDGKAAIAGYLRTAYQPDTLVIDLDPEVKEQPLFRIAPDLAELEMVDDRTTVYLCKGTSCSAPVHTLEELRSLLT